MLSDGVEREGSSFKRIFEICSLDLKNNKKIAISLYNPEDWPSKNLYTYALSPNGCNIAFVIESHDEQLDWQSVNALHVMSRQDFKIETILSSRAFPRIGSICWSADGEHIFFVGKLKNIEDTSTNIPQFNSLYELNLKTKEIHELVRYNVGGINSQSCSPDGMKIVYEKSKSDEIFVYDFSIKSSDKLIDGKSPTWSPNGDKIAYWGNDGNYYLVTPQGTENHMFIKNEAKRKFKVFGERILGISGKLLWSPDGRYVYYERTAISFLADVEHHLPYIMDVATKEEIKLPKEFENIKSWIGQKK